MARFITIEGGEGAGKSTAQQFLASKLISMGLSVTLTREPGGTPLAEELRQTSLNPHVEVPVEMAELLLLFAARAQHIANVIKPALDRGEWVLCDRFTDATYAYQGGARGMSLEVITQLEEMVQGALQPHQVILLDLPPEVGLERARARGELDRFEREPMAFYERVRSGYLERVRTMPGRYTVIDASQDLQGVEDQLDCVAQGWLAK